MNSRRILARLWAAEMREPNTHFKSDIRQSWICVSLASRGEPQPFITSSYRMYGIHPANVWPRIVAERKAKLGPEYWMWYDDDGRLRPDVVIPDYDPFIRPISAAPCAIQAAPGRVSFEPPQTLSRAEALGSKSASSS